MIDQRVQKSFIHYFSILPDPRDDLKFLFSHSDFPKVEPLHIEAQLWIEPSSEWISTYEHCFSQDEEACK